MTIYFLLRHLIESIVWRNEALKADALKLIDELEKMNAFGTLASTMEVNAHAHVDEWAVGETDGIRVFWKVCRVCRRIDQESRTIERPYSFGYQGLR